MVYSSEEELITPPASRSKQRAQIIGFSSAAIGFVLVIVSIAHMDFNGSTGSLSHESGHGNVRGHKVASKLPWQFTANSDSEDIAEEDIFLEDTVETNVGWELEELYQCTEYLKTETCHWTLEWNCPGQAGGRGDAQDDESLGYNCCCEQNYWKKLPQAPTSHWNSGNHRNWTVYHQTSPEICDHIMKEGFRLGKGGVCGKAIYFARSPHATAAKAITRYSHGGCMIEAVVDVGIQDHYYGDGGMRHRGDKYCGRMNAQRLHATGVDTVLLTRGDGQEIIFYEPERILEMRTIPFQCNWMCHGACHKHWPDNCRYHWR